MRINFLKIVVRGLELLNVMQDSDKERQPLTP